MKKLLLLGSGELGKELTIALKRLGQYVVACDSYDDAPAMQVADEREVIDMLSGDELDRVVAKHTPDIIIPEIEAIKTERFYDYEQQGMQVIPSARAANFTMNRKAIRDLAAKELGLRTADFEYATTLTEFTHAVARIGIPCVVKPLMSSSGKGQSVIRTDADVAKAWEIAVTKGRAHMAEVIVEEFIEFHSEITLLTVTQRNGQTIFAPPIGHRQERGDYMESWQPALIAKTHLIEAQQMAKAVTEALTGYGIWGVEFFLADDGVYFSELSPRPHDTGMVTLAGSQTFSEFELHARAILGLPIPNLQLERVAASAVILAIEDNIKPIYTGVEDAISEEDTDIRIFGKPITREYRRMGVALAWTRLDSDEVIEDEIDEVRKRAMRAAGKVRITA